MISRSQVRFSIYYPNQGWPDLLSNCLIDLFGNLSETPLGGEFLMFFSDEQGDHIRLIINAPDLRKSEQYKTAVESFLSAKPIEQLIKPLPINNGFFLDIPTNALYEDIFKPYLSPINKLNEIQLYLIRKLISSLMLEAFSTEVVTIDSSFNFYLCLKITALSVFNSPVYARRFISSEFDMLASNFTTQQLTLLNTEAESLIDNNLADFNQLMYVMDGRPFAAEYNWLAKWVQQCRDVAMESEPISLYREMGSLICQHLNFYEPKRIAMSVLMMKFLLKNN